MITKAYAKNGRSCRVTFELPEAPQAQSGAILGEFNDWNPESHRLKPGKDGGLSLAVSLPAGRQYRFRYLLDGERWANDETADAYVPNQFGSLDAVLDLADVEAVETPVTAPKPAKAAKPAPAASAKPATAAKAAKKKTPAAPAAPARRRPRPTE
jgi:1,4-alpha-glucan branching enzyme